jgi:hypothetical protein
VAPSLRSNACGRRPSQARHGTWLTAPSPRRPRSAKRCDSRAGIWRHVPPSKRLPKAESARSGNGSGTRHPALCPTRAAAVSNTEGRRFEPCRPCPAPPGGIAANKRPSESPRQEGAARGILTATPGLEQWALDTAPRVAPCDRAHHHPENREAADDRERSLSGVRVTVAPAQPLHERGACRQLPRGRILAHRGASRCIEVPAVNLPLGRRVAPPGFGCLPPDGRVPLPP